MNIFDKKLKASNVKDLPLMPIELYQTCQYQEGYGYLRGIQEEVLKVWQDNRVIRDTICKMNTGSGKTLTGLLMLYSKLIEKVGPCLYVCPDNQLLNQTIEQAKLYGIPVCTFEKTSALPSDFMNGKSILVCSFHKLFNGKSVFTKHNISLGAILLDDAHKCVDIAREQSTIRLRRIHPIALKLFNLFSNELKHQLPGTYYRLVEGDPTMNMKVPYWIWLEHHEVIIKIISEYISSLEDDDDSEISLKLNWNLISNNLLSYDCYVGGEVIEITPIHVPYHEVPAFNDAKYRFILSATFEDDYDLIKDFGITFENILKPILPKDRKDVGKRLILAPTRFDTNMSDEKIREFISNYPKEGFNVIVLVPSAAKANIWKDYGATLVNKENIQDSVIKLKSSQGNFMIFINRYDGLDLHNDLCRILVIDGLPLYTTLQEHYTEIRLDSVRMGRKAQIIEQGLGRSTRSGGDYSVVYLMGLDLVNFVSYENNLAHFTPITRAQINLGLQLLDGEAIENSLETIKETANYCLTQHSSWHKYHTDALLEVSVDPLDSMKEKKLQLAEIERKSIEQFRKRNYGAAAEIILKEIIDSLDLTNKEMAWYYQFAAQLIYLKDPVVSNDLQIKASETATNMFHPSNAYSYKKIKFKGVQAAEVCKLLASFVRPQDVLNKINEILKYLVYNPQIDSERFENSLSELGEFLGFTVQRPEKELNNGPDVLWCMTDGHYLILEAKSQAVHPEISRENIGQLLISEEWFKSHYPNLDYTPVTLQPTNKKGKNVNLSEGTRVLDQQSLDTVHDNLRRFANALQGKATNSHTEKEIGDLLVAFKLTPSLFRDVYLKKIQG